MTQKPITISFADENKKPSSTIIIEPQSIDDSTSISLIGENTRYYGKQVMQSMLNLLERFASPIEPINPTEGQMWFDSSENLLKIAYVHTPYDQNNPEQLPILRWREIGIPRVSDLYHRLPIGDLLWYNTDDEVTQIRDYTTNTWTTLGSDFLPLSGTRQPIRGDVTLQELLTVENATTVYGNVNANNIRVTNQISIQQDVIVGNADSFFTFNYTGTLPQFTSDIMPNIEDSILFSSGENIKINARMVHFFSNGVSFIIDNDATSTNNIISGTTYVDFNDESIYNCKYDTFDFSVPFPAYIDDDIAVTAGILDDFLTVHNTVGGNTELLITGDSMDMSTTLSVDDYVYVRNANKPSIVFENNSTGCCISVYTFFNHYFMFHPKQDGIYNNDPFSNTMCLFLSESGWEGNNRLNDPTTIVLHVPDSTDPTHACNRNYVTTKIAAIATELASIDKINEGGKIKGSVNFRMGKTGDNIVVNDNGSFNVQVKYIPPNDSLVESTKHKQLPRVTTTTAYWTDWIYGKSTDYFTITGPTPSSTAGLEGNIEPSNAYAIYEIYFNDISYSSWNQSVPPPIGTIVSQDAAYPGIKNDSNLSSNDNMVSLYNIEATPCWVNNIPCVRLYVAINYNFMLPLMEEQPSKYGEIDRIIQQFRTRLPFNYYSDHNDQFYYNEGPKQIFEFEKYDGYQEMWNLDDAWKHHNKGNELTTGTHKNFPGRPYGYIRIDIQLDGDVEYNFTLALDVAVKALNAGSGWQNGITYPELILILNYATQNMTQISPSLVDDAVIAKYRSYFKWRISVDHHDYQAVECIYIGPDPETTLVKIYDDSSQPFFSNGSYNASIYKGTVYDETEWLPRPYVKNLNAIFFW